ncbi:putative carboxylesterase 11 [Glycine max]|nr:putative carboxylesterase 11 [Glycine max]
MPSVAVKLYSVFFKFLLKHRLQNRIQGRPEDSDPFGVTTRPDESVAPANPSFSDGVATKDIHIDPLTSLSIRIFLPDSALEPNSQPSSKPEPGSVNHETSSLRAVRRNSYEPAIFSPREEERRNSGGDSGGCGGAYRGYAPSPAGNGRRKKLPVVLQFHGGGWVSGSNDSVANDVFCRRVARLCEAVVVAVGYRLAPENRYPAAFEDGLKVLNWLAKQANLAECTKSMGGRRRLEGQHKHIVETFGASVVEPWLAAHGNPSRIANLPISLAKLGLIGVYTTPVILHYRIGKLERILMIKEKGMVDLRCVLLGVSCGANIADYVARKAVETGTLLDPVKVVAQVLMYPFFIGSVPTRSEIKLANSYFYDKAMCMLAWKLFLPEEEFSLDHPAANPLAPGHGPPLKKMPPTLTVVAEHDWMRDRAIAYSEELRKVNVDAPVYEYKDAVHEFATLDVLLKSPQAQVCAEDIAIWVKKYISLRGHEFSY